MDSFEEQFPSLKKKFDIWMMPPYHNLRIIDEIQENCIDKQRVREAIERVRQQIEGSYTIDAAHFGMIMKRELGL